MPDLIGVLRTASDPEMRTLRCKVMECAGIIGRFDLYYIRHAPILTAVSVAIAVGRDLFEPQSKELAELLLHIQRAFLRFTLPCLVSLLLTYRRPRTIR